MSPYARYHTSCMVPSTLGEAKARCNSLIHAVWIPTMLKFELLSLLYEVRGLYVLVENRPPSQAHCRSKRRGRVSERDRFGEGYSCGPRDRQVHATEGVKHSVYQCRGCAGIHPSQPLRASQARGWSGVASTACDNKWNNATRAWEQVGEADKRSASVR